jgi:hypothetical protein
MEAADFFEALVQINVQFNGVSSADENKKYHCEPLFKHYKKTIHLFIVRRHRSCTCF